ncbi:MAG: TRAP transporter substrate-binding protein [Tissierellales bacterium]|jgi:C4-dicarboxylate-binding protein DctP|nr:TRAP transporter substrate-binding protein [Tissierellales bacterium]
MLFKKRKLSLVLVLLISLSMILAGCSSNQEAPENEVGENESVEEEILIKFSHNQPTSSPEHAGALKFKEVAEAESNGKVKVDIYPASQLGSLREQVEGVQMGTINISMQPSAVISPFVDDIKVCDLPYLWPNDREVIYEVLDGEMGTELLGRLEQGGFHGLGYWFGGYKLFTTKDTEIHQPSDFEGLKMRVMEAPILISQYEAWGGNPVPLPYAELYNGLQQGIVDGQENPLQTVYLNNFHEVQNQIIEGYHGTMMYVMIANQEWFDGLSEEIQTIVENAEQAGREEARKSLLETENEYRQNIIDSGVNYYELTDTEIEKFVEASRPVHEEHYDGEWQKDYINRLYEALEEASK